MGFRYIFQNPLMQKFLHILAILVTTVVLAACGGGSSSTSPSAPTAAASTTGWTWVGGSKYSGVFSYDFTAQGVGSTLNMPGARSTSVSWIDRDGNFWIFGGLTENAITFLGDLWRYNPKTKEWAWMDGSLTADTVGSYGTQGIAASSNAPGARIGPVAWTDTSATSGCMVDLAMAKAVDLVP
jgi:hypothetical protein